jgi:hypothetical protein
MRATNRICIQVGFNEMSKRLRIEWVLHIHLYLGITHVFQSAAFRFGHTLIPPGIYMRDAQCNFKKTAEGGSAIRLCASWWDSDVRT